ncbi:protein vac14 [Anaeramoeba ignava]|uniref:Protein vac14 n=1 Tax=Anaeramoeba ignava TaxID=1746090 RepID=A0A9Q0LXN9_ANAIG|nr:protein vac14 [Anaeramoeba ignava]
MDFSVSESIQRNLFDKTYEKRKQAGKEITISVIDFTKQDQHEKTSKLIQFLTNKLLNSPNINQRKGCLMGLSAIAVGLGDSLLIFQDLILKHVIYCFSDPDFSVRFAACEVFYNIAKVSKDQIFSLIKEILVGFSVLFSDQNDIIKKSVRFLDNLLKDFVTESISNSKFRVQILISILKELIYVKNGMSNYLLLVGLIQSIQFPEVDILTYISQLLDGLYHFLSSQRKEVQQSSEKLLAEVLKELSLQKIEKTQDIDYKTLVKISTLYSESMDIKTTETALEWMRVLISMAYKGIFPFPCEHLPSLMKSMIFSLSNENEKISTSAKHVNSALIKLVKSEYFDVRNIYDSVFQIIVKVSEMSVINLLQFEPTFYTSLEWVSIIHKKSPKKFESFSDNFFPHLLLYLSNPSDNILSLAISILCELSGLSHEKFEIFILNLVEFFQQKQDLLTTKGVMILEKVAHLVDDEQLFRQLSLVLQKEKQLKFRQIMVQSLNFILLTSPEVENLRNLLIGIHSDQSQHNHLLSNFDRAFKDFHSLQQKTEEEEKFEKLSLIDPKQKNSQNFRQPTTPSKQIIEKDQEQEQIKEDIFEVIFKAWCCCTGSTLSLCFLAQDYSLASDLIQIISQVDMTVLFLKELEIFAHFFDSFVFVFQRLHLTEPSLYQKLYEALYRLISVVPQEGQFLQLKKRVESVSHLKFYEPFFVEENKSFAVQKLVLIFDETQNKHRKQNLVSKNSIMNFENDGILSNPHFNLFAKRNFDSADSQLNIESKKKQLTPQKPKLKKHFQNLKVSSSYDSPLSEFVFRK